MALPQLKDSIFGYAGQEFGYLLGSSLRQEPSRVAKSLGYGRCAP